MAPILTLISLALAFVAHASPTPERRLTHVPREATKLAADPETGTIYLFNSRDEHLGVLDRDAASAFQRRAGGCSGISADEVQQRECITDFQALNWVLNIPSSSRLEQAEGPGERVMG